MNEATIKLLTQAGMAAMVLAVLVWQLDQWTQERGRQAESQERQRTRLIEVMTGSVREAHEDRRQLTATIEGMTRQMIERDSERNAVDSKIINILEKNNRAMLVLQAELQQIDESLRAQGKSITRSIQKKP